MCLLRQGGTECGLTCSFIRFLLAPVPTLMILVANSTPMVCDESTLHSFLTKRCSKQDLVSRDKAQISEMLLKRGERLCSCVRETAFEVVCIRLRVHSGGFGVGGITHLPVPLGPSNMILAR